MSILIKGAKMPERCIDCPMNTYGLVCQLTTNYYRRGMINRAPDCPLEEVSEWTPESERRPKENKRYLVTLSQKASEEDLGFELDETRVRIMMYHDKWMMPRISPKEVGDAIRQKILAWMPLPECYKGDKT